MRKMAVMLLALGGCYYDAPNPWDTSSDMRRYQDMKERDWELEMEHPFDPPQQSPPEMVDPDLEAWRDTVLVTADGESLKKMREWTLAKLADLARRRAELLRVDELSRREQFREVEYQIRINRLRLRLLDDRASR